MAVESTKPLPKIIFENLSNNEDIIKNGAVLVEETSSSPEALVEKNILNENNIPAVLSPQEKTRYKNIGLEFNASVIDNFNKRLIAEKNEQEMLIEDDKDTILESLKDSVKERLKNKIKNSGQNNNNELMGKLLLAGLAIGSIGAFIKEKVEKWWGNIRGFFDNFFKDGLDKITDFFGKPFDNLKNLGTEMKNKITEVVTELGTKIEKVFVGENNKGGLLGTISKNISEAFEEVVEAIKKLGDVSEGSFDEGTIDDVINGMANMGSITDDRINHEKQVDAEKEVIKRLTELGFTYSQISEMSNKERLAKIQETRPIINNNYNEKIVEEIKDVHYNKDKLEHFAGGIFPQYDLTNSQAELFIQMVGDVPTAIDLISNSEKYTAELDLKNSFTDEKVIADLLKKYKEAENTKFGGGFDVLKAHMKQIVGNRLDTKQFDKLLGNYNQLFLNKLYTKQELQDRQTLRDYEKIHKKETKDKTLAQLQAEEEMGIGPQRRHDEAKELVTSQTDKLIAEIANFLKGLSPQTFADNLAAAIKEVFAKLKFELHFEIPKDSPEPTTQEQPPTSNQDSKNKDVIRFVAEKSNDFDTGIALLIGEQNVVLRNINENFKAITNLIQKLPTGQTGNTTVVNVPVGQPRQTSGTSSTGNGVQTRVLLAQPS